jgi:hypothetical protein
VEGPGWTAQDGWPRGHRADAGRRARWVSRPVGRARGQRPTGVGPCR